MDLDHAPAEAPVGAAVLLHPHPDYGGDRFHPLVDALHRSLPAHAVSWVRFDFSTGDVDGARAQVVEALDTAAGVQAALRVVLIGYSFGAGVAATVDDPRVAGWCLVAPPAAMLHAAAVGSDPRPKRLVVPADDQFGPPESAGAVIDGWAAATLEVVDGADHFLAGAIGRIAGDAVAWATGLLAGG